MGRRENPVVLPGARSSFRASPAWRGAGSERARPRRWARSCLNGPARRGHAAGGCRTVRGFTQPAAARAAQVGRAASAAAAGGWAISALSGAPLTLAMIFVSNSVSVQSEHPPHTQNTAWRSGVLKPSHAAGRRGRAVAQDAIGRRNGRGEWMAWHFPETRTRSARKCGR